MWEESETLTDLTILETYDVRVFFISSNVDTRKRLFSVRRTKAAGRVGISVGYSLSFLATHIFSCIRSLFSFLLVISIPSHLSFSLPSATDNGESWLLPFILPGDLALSPFPSFFG